MRPDAAITTSALLTAAEARELGRLESAIESGLQTFYDVGVALAAIRDKWLYRATHKTFEAYLRDRFDIHRDTAYAKIAAAQVVQIVGNSDKRPNESQASQLVGLEPDQQRAVWERAVSTAPKGKVTAAHVAAVVEELTGRPPGANPGEVSVGVAEALAALPPEERHALLTRKDAEAVEESEDDDGGETTSQLPSDAHDQAERWGKWLERMDRELTASDLDWGRVVPRYLQVLREALAEALVKLAG